MCCVVENVAGGLVNRHGTGAGRGIGCLACMKCARCESWCVFILVIVVGLGVKVNLRCVPECLSHPN